MGLRPSVWSGRRVLLTGHTGFKGAWLAVWLERLGAHVTGLALTAEPGSAWERLTRRPGESIEADIRDAEAVGAAAERARPEVVLHLAAQALVRRSYAEPVATFATNVVGTLHVLEAAHAVGSAGAAVVVTSDKVYENDGRDRPFREDDRLGGHDPYSASKAAAEIAVASWRAARPGLPVATARAGNVIGGGDVAADRLVPDALRAVDAGVPLALRNPGATRPWQFVLEPLLGYLLLAQELLERPASAPAAVNFGPRDPGATVAEVADAVFERCGAGAWEVDGGEHPKEAPTLRVDPTLAGEALGWAPTLRLEEAVGLVVDWHRAVREGRDMRDVMDEQIAAFEARIS